MSPLPATLPMLAQSQSPPQTLTTSEVTVTSISSEMTTSTTITVQSEMSSSSVCTTSSNNSSSDHNNGNTSVINSDNNTVTIKDKDNVEIGDNDNNNVTNVQTSECDTLVTTTVTSQIESSAISNDSETLNSSSVNMISDVESSPNVSVNDSNKKSVLTNKIDTATNKSISGSNSSSSNTGNGDVVSSNTESCSKKINTNTNDNNIAKANNKKCRDIPKPNKSDKKNISNSDKNKDMNCSIKEEKTNENEVLDKPRKILLRNINPHIICNLCKGYLIDATTIVECLHSFCHSCIMKHLRTEQYCPRCEMMINTAKPNIKPDTTLQAIVYKLVPGLYEKELMRKRAFYRDRPDDAKLATPEQRGEDTEYLIFGPTENMSLSLEYADIEKLPEGDWNELKRPKYLQCPAIFTVAHLKKFILLKFGINPNLFSVEIMYKVKTIVLSNHYTLMDVAYIYTWKRDAPMRFFFRITQVDNFEEKLKACRQSMKAKEMNNENKTQQKSSLSEENNSNCTKNSDVSKNGLNKNVGQIKTVIKNEEESIEKEMIIDHNKVCDGAGNQAVARITCHEDNLSQQKSNEDNNTGIGKIPFYETCKTLITDFKKEKDTEDDNNFEKVESIKTKIEVKEEPFEPSATEQNLDRTIENTVNNGSKVSVAGKVSEENQSGQERSNDNKIAITNKPEKLKMTFSVRSKQSKIIAPVKETKTDLSSRTSNKSSKTTRQQQHSGASQNKSSEQEERKVENIKLKIDLSKQSSVTIINMSGSESNRKEIVKPVKQEKECKQKARKDKEISPKLSPKGEDIYKIKASENQRNSSENNTKLLVPPITIKAERISPTSKELSTIQLKVKQEESESYKINDITTVSDKDDDEEKSKFLNSFALTPIKSTNSPGKDPQVPLWTASNVPTSNKTAQVSKRKSKEPIKTLTKRTRIESTKTTKDEYKISRSNDKTSGKECQTISFNLAPYPIDSSSSTQLSKKQEDEKLMPAPPPLKMIDVFKKNGIKQAKQPRSSKWTAANKTKLTSLTNQVAAPPGSLTPRPIIPAGIASSKLPITTAHPGNRTPIARRYPPILPKSPRPNPFANLSTDVKLLQSNGTEIKQIPSENNQEIKVYGPAMVTKNTQKSINSTMSVPNMSAARGTIKGSNTNYLNYALINASKTKIDVMALGCRTPIYTPSSPIYSPNSPQYMPNYNIPTQPTYKYTKSQSSASNYLQNVLGQNNQLSNLFPAPPIKKPPEVVIVGNSKTSPPQVSITTDYLNDENSIKRPYPFSKSPPTISDKTSETPGKQAKVQSLLNSCNINIPSSLSITITNEDSNLGTTSGSNIKRKSPVNNYIEILKLPDNQSVISTEQLTADQKLSTGNHTEAKSDKTVVSSSAMVPTAAPMKTITSNSTSRLSPIQVTGSQSTKSTPSPCSVQSLIAANSMEKKSDTKSISPNSKDKKLSPEKKTAEKNQKKTGQTGQDKKKYSESTSGKSAKTSDNGNVTASLKKFRHILPRVTTTSQNITTTTLSVSMPTITSSIQKSSPKQLQQKVSPNASSRKQSLNSAKITSETDDKKLEVLDLTGSTSKTPPPSIPSLPITLDSTSNPTIQTPSPQMPPGASDIAAFLNETILRAQQHSTNSNGIFLPHLAAAASFNPSFASINFGYNIQQAYLMEQFSRMQKAGHEALEKYMQKLKTGAMIAGTKSGPSSPCDSSSTPSITSTAIANNNAVVSPAKNNDSN